MATTIITITPGQVKKYFGNYDYYLEKSAAENPPQENQQKNFKKAESAVPAVGKDRRRERAEIRQKYAAARKKLQKQADDMEKKLEKLSSERDQLLEELNCGRVTDFRSTNRRIAELEVDIADATSKWEDAALQLEELEEKVKAETE